MNNTAARRNSRTSKAVTIANGASLSDAAFLNKSRLVALIFPSGWGAASKTFQGSIDGITYNNIYDGDGNEITLPSHGEGAVYQALTASQQLAVLGAVYLKLRSGTSGSAVNQSGGDIVTLVLEPL